MPLRIAALPYFAARADYDDEVYFSRRRYAFFFAPLPYAAAFSTMMASRRLLFTPLLRFRR